MAEHNNGNHTPVKKPKMLIISAHNSFKKVGGQLAVVHPAQDILQLFKTMRIHQHVSAKLKSDHQ